MELGVLNLVLIARTSREHPLLVQILKLIMVHNCVERVLQQQLQILVQIDHVNKILQLKVIKIVIYGFHQLAIVKFVFGMVQMDVFLLNNALHFKEQWILVLNIPLLMAPVKE